MLPIHLTTENTCARNTNSHQRTARTSTGYQLSLPFATSIATTSNDSKSSFTIGYPYEVPAIPTNQRVMPHVQYVANTQKCSGTSLNAPTPLDNRHTTSFSNQYSPCTKLQTLTHTCYNCYGKASTLFTANTKLMTNMMHIQQSFRKCSWINNGLDGNSSSTVI